MSSGISCPRCGASTPLPDDLRVPTFTCRFCQAVLETAAFAGRAATTADALLGHLHEVVKNPSTAVASAASAPRYEGGSTESLPSQCIHCRAPVAVPLDLHVSELVCTACGRVQPVNAHISDAKRFELDMARQLAGNEALKRIQAEGVPCATCGAPSPVPTGGVLQIACRYCGATFLLSEHVDATAVARQRLKHGVYAMRDELMRKQAARDRTIKLVVAVIVALVLGALVIANVIAAP